MSEVALSAQQLAVIIGSRTLLHDINAALAVGRWCSIVGPNGAGKSTFLKALAGILPVPAQVQGHIQFGGRALHGISPRERARQVAWLGQGETVLDDLPAYDIVMLGRLPHRAWLAPPTAVDHAAVEEALRQTEAWQWRARPLSQLSGGERQRVLLARVLAVQARVVLMDEPLNNLDPPHQSNWLQTVRTLVSQGTTVVSVLHEISIALQADDLLIMDAGNVLHHGPCHSVMTHRILEQVFDQCLQVRHIDGMWVALPYLKPSFNSPCYE